MPARHARGHSGLGRAREHSGLGSELLRSEISQRCPLQHPACSGRPANADGDTAGSIPNSFGRNYRSCVPRRLLRGTLSRVLRGTFSRVLRGTFSRVLRGTFSRVLRGTFSRVLRGTLSRVLRGTFSRVLRVANPRALLFSSKRLPQRNMKLKNIDPLRRLDPAPKQQLILRPLETKKARRIRAQRQIHAQRTHRRLVPDTEPQRLHPIIEILLIALPETKADTAQIGIDVANIVEQHATDVPAEQRKTQFHGIDQQRFSANRKPGLKIARPSLVVRKGPLRRRSAGEKPLRQRNVRQ